MDSNDFREQDTRNGVLMQRYEFYTQEARHQRMMMWETAKWFAAIVVGLLYVSGQLFIRFQDSQNKTFVTALEPISVLILILLISLMCLLLIRSFYRTNLIYISMLAKVEDELGFDEREKGRLRHVFRDDDYITWHIYRRDRQETETSEVFVDGQVKVLGKGIYARLSFVFIIFCVFSIAAIIHLICRV